MSSRPNWHPLSLVGAVLLLCSVVFAVLSFSLQASGFMGVMVGCAGTGIALSVVGFVLNGRMKDAGNDAQ